MIIVTRGYGPGASIPAVVRRGYQSADISTYLDRKPATDILEDSWVAVGAATLSAALGDGLTANDSTYIESPTDPADATCIVKLNAPGGPTPIAPVHLTFRVKQDNIDQRLNLTTAFKQGTNVIGLWTNDINSTIFTTFTNELTAEQISQITNWDDLYLEFDANTPNTDTLKLLLTSQFGVGADDTHTVYDRPWFRVTLNDADRLVGDTMQLVIDGIDNNSAILTSTDIANGYIDIQVSGALAAGSYSTRSCRIRSGNRSALSESATITIFKRPFDGMANLYAAHGVQRLLTSYTGPLVRIIRTTDNVEKDLYAGIDGYLNMAEGFVFCVRQGNDPTINVVKLYDQTGNGRDATPPATTKRPIIWNKGIVPTGNASPDASWGWRSALHFSESTLDQLSVSGMSAFAQNVGAISIAGSFGWVFFGKSGGGFDRTPVTISTNGSTNRRAALFTTTAVAGIHGVRAGGRRLDADTEADTSQLNATLYSWTPIVARFDYTNAKLYYNAFGASTTLDPFQTSGSTSDTASSNVTMGGNAGSEGYEGSITGLGWFQRKLTDDETTELTTTSQLNYRNITRRHLIRPGATMAVEAFRQAIITKLFIGTSGFPTSGVWDSNQLNVTDPYANLSPSMSPTNLLQFDKHTLNLKNDLNVTVSTQACWVWYPTVATSNGKLIIYQVGYENVGSSAFNDPLFVKSMVEEGYTIAQVSAPFGNGMPFGDATATLTPLRYYVETAIHAVNAFSPSFNKVLVFGFSGGASTSCLMAAIDPRVSATVSFDYNVPIYADTQSRYERALIGLADLTTTGGCDFPDLWLLGTTGKTSEQRSLYLANVGSQATWQLNCADFFTEVFEVCALYGGVFGTHFDTFDTGHEIGVSTIELCKTVFGRY